MVTVFIVLSVPFLHVVPSCGIADGACVPCPAVAPQGASRTELNHRGGAAVLAVGINDNCFHSYASSVSENAFVGVQRISCVCNFSLLVQRKVAKENTLRRGRFRILPLLRTSLIETAKGGLQAPSWIPPGIWGPYVLAAVPTLAVARKGTDCRVASLLAMTWKRETPAKRRASSCTQGSAKRSGSARYWFRQSIPRLRPDMWKRCQVSAGTGSDNEEGKPRSAPFSFFHRARRYLSFRQDEKKDRGAHGAGHVP